MLQCVLKCYATNRCGRDEQVEGYDTSKRRIKKVHAIKNMLKNLLDVQQSWERQNESRTHRDISQLLFVHKDARTRYQIHARHNCEEIKCWS